MEKEQKIKLDKKKIIAIVIAAVLIIGVAAFLIADALKKPQTELITEPVAVIEDSDDDDTAVVAEQEKSNIVILKDEEGNDLSLIPINDAANEIMLCGYIRSAKDSAGNEITSQELIGRVVAVSADTSSGARVYSLTMKDGKKVFLEYYTNEQKQIVAVQSAVDGKFYEVVTEQGEGDNVYMHLKADAKGNPIEVAVKNENGKTKIVEKGTNTTVSDDASKGGGMGGSGSGSGSGGGSGSTPSPDNPQEEEDKVIGFVDYSELADVNIILKSDSKAAVGLDALSPIQVDVREKAYVDDGVLYLKGNGDYYISSESSGSWYGKIVVELGNQGLARVRLAGVDIVSSDSRAIEFIDTNTVINDKDNDGEVLVYKNTAATKNNPNAVLSFVTGTENTLRANGNSIKGSGTIYSECKLSIKGHGTANIESKNKNGIQTERSLAIQNCTLNINATAGKGIRSKGTLNIEECAEITVHSMGDAVRCNEFIMETDVRDASGEKDKSTGSKVNLYPRSGSASATSGDGIDADDAVIIRAGELNIEVESDKEKYGIKVRRVNNEEFLDVIKSQGITDITEFKNAEAAKAEEERNLFYRDVVLNEKEYTALMQYKDISSGSADYQGIRTASGCRDTFRITGGEVKVMVKLGRNSTILPSTNNQASISAYSTKIQRGIDIGGFYSADSVRALIYSSDRLNASEEYTVTFAANGKRNKKVEKKTSFENRVCYVTDEV